MVNPLHQRSERERTLQLEIANQAGQAAQASSAGLFGFQTQIEEKNEPSIESERAKLKRLQREYRRAVSTLKPAATAANTENARKIMRKNSRLHNLLTAIHNLIEAEADNNEKQFHRWFFVMAKAYDEFESYLEGDDEIRTEEGRE